MRVIRRATTRDVPALAGLLAAHLVEHQRTFPDVYPRLNVTAATVHYAADWGRRLDTDPTCHVWLAADRDLRGFLAGEVWSRPVGEPTPVFFAEWLYVVPEHRGTGLARALWREGLVPYCLAHDIGVVEGRAVPGDAQWEARGWTVGGQVIYRPVVALARDVAERPAVPAEEEPHDPAR
jgi:GNAT superfamily N-acetyltransferase